MTTTHPALLASPIVRAVTHSYTDILTARPSGALIRKVQSLPFEIPGLLPNLGLVRLHAG